MFAQPGRIIQLKIPAIYKLYFKPWFVSSRTTFRFISKSFKICGIPLRVPSPLCPFV